MRLLSLAFLALALVPLAAANGDDHGHGGEPLFDSGLIQPTKTYELQLWDDGTFVYHCHPHPWMEGQLVVSEADDGAAFSTFHVEIRDGNRTDFYQFEPAVVEARIGDTIVWHNNGTFAHTVTSDDVTVAADDEDSPTLGLLGVAAAVAVALAARRRSR